MAWRATEHPGVRYREHPTRRVNGRPDRYYSIRYGRNYIDHEEGLGWASEGWTPKKAAAVLAELRKAHTTGTGPQTLGEIRAEAEAQRERQARAEKREALRAMTLEKFLLDYELPRLKKETRGWRKDESRIRHRIIPALGAIPLAAITPADITNFLDALRRDGLAQATINHHSCILSKAYRNASNIIIDGCPIFSGRSLLRA